MFGADDARRKQQKQSRRGPTHAPTKTTHKTHNNHNNNNKSQPQTETQRSMQQVKLHLHPLPNLHTRHSKAETLIRTLTKTIQPHLQRTFGKSPIIRSTMRSSKRTRRLSVRSGFEVRW
jgi:hypothetical protein